MYLKLKKLTDTSINIARREIKVRYAGSFLGALWYVIQPVAFSLITAVIFSIVFKGYAGETPYFIYALAGFNSWLWFSQTLNIATKSLIYNRELIANNKFPTESIILGICLSRIPDYVLGTLVLLTILLSQSRFPGMAGIILLIVLAFLQFIFQTGLALITSSVNVRLRDFQNLVEIFLQLYFYLTPVIYTLEMVPESVRNYIYLNPMSLLLSSQRTALFNNSVDTSILMIIALFSVFTFCMGFYIYKIGEKKYAELL